MKRLSLASLALVAAALPARAEDRPLSAAEVRKVVEARMGDVKACMKQHAPDGQGQVTGKVVVHYLIQPSGKVEKPSVHESSTGNKALDACIVGIFPKLQFPPPRGWATMEELYPFVFAPPKNPPKQEAQGTLEREQIQKTIEANIKDVLGCYEKAQESEPKLEGVVVLEMTVDKDGKVAKTNKLESTTKYTPVDDCIAGAVGKWQFPKPQGGGNVVIAYPFKLQRGSKSDKKGAP